MVDLTNAFNTVDRWVVRKAIRRVFPEGAPWTDLCYGGPSAVLLGGHEISSSRGVQQGDPFGPALFALAIHEVVMGALAATQEVHPGGIDWAAFYLDDGTLAGTSEAIAFVLC